MYTLEDIKEEIEKGTSLVSLYKKFGGFDIYIPKVMPNYKEKAIEEFNGYNHAVLATKYNVSKNQIYKIVREDKKAKGLC